MNWFNLSPTDTGYVVFATFLALLYWTALVLLLLASRRYNHWLKRFGLMVITLAVALFWSTSAIMRVTHTTDATLLNMWSRVLYAMLAFYVLGFAWMNWKIPRAKSEF